MLKNLHRVVLIIMCFSCKTAYGQDTIRCLAIGNSFSEAAVEWYLHPIGKTENIVFIIGNLFIPGCSLEMHWKNVEKNLPAYNFRKVDQHGIRQMTQNSRLDSVLTSDNWDYITLQQSSPNSGMIYTYIPYLENLVQYIRNKATNPSAKVAFHQTWAYSMDCTYPPFKNYENNQLKMYQSILNVSLTEVWDSGIDFVIPCGTVIQNLRESLGDVFCGADGFHLNQFGSYLAAYTWFKALTVKDMGSNNFKPTPPYTMDLDMVQKIVDSTVTCFPKTKPVSLKATHLEDYFLYLKTGEDTYLIEADLVPDTPVNLEVVYPEDARCILFNGQVNGRVQIPFTLETKGFLILRFKAGNKFLKTLKILNF